MFSTLRFRSTLLLLLLAIVLPLSAELREYTLFSSGMPQTATITIRGASFRGVNAQGDTKFKGEPIEESDVKVMLAEKGGRVKGKKTGKSIQGPGI